MAVKVVTDSTSDIPPELAAKLGITVIPLTVFFGDQPYKDGVDISTDEFFVRLTTGSVLPRTTQPTVGEFAEVYKPLVEAGHEVVSVHVSSKMSGTINSALSARQEFPDAKIEVVDSGLASMALALVAKAAAIAANGGASSEEVVKVANDTAEHIDLYFVLDTLEYLQKGGRIGRAQALLGGLLSIKPVLKVIDGEIHPHEKVRTRAKALKRMREIAAEGSPYAEIAFIHMATPEEIAELEEYLAPLASEPLISGRIGPVIGTYTGPGVVGFALRRA
ncbi:MAG: DegV family protein [Dehalococcoidia bacterium]